MEISVSPSSPPSPKVDAAKRRSKASFERRLSRVSGGQGGGVIPLASLLESSVPGEGEASPRERLETVIRLCINNAVSQVNSEVGEDEELSETANEVGKAVRLRSGDLVEEGIVTRVLAQLDKGQLQTHQGDNISLERKKVLNKTAKYKAEHNQWREVVVQRKEENRRARLNLQKLSKGELCIQEDRKYSLTQEQRAVLDRIPDWKASMDSLKEHKARKELLLEEVATKATLLKRKMENRDEDLSKATRVLRQKADLAGGMLQIVNPEDLLGL